MATVLEVTMPSMQIVYRDPLTMEDAQQLVDTISEAMDAEAGLIAQIANARILQTHFAGKLEVNHV